MSVRRGAALVVALATLPVLAQERDESAMFGATPASDAGVAASATPAPDGGAASVDEAEMFGQQPSPAPSPAQQASTAPRSGGEETNGLTGQDALGFKTGESPDAFATGEAGAVNPLTIGGQLYLRDIFQESQGQPPGQSRFSAPTLVDGYLDARPTDRVRGFVLARMQYDPTLNGQGQTVGTSTSAFGSSSVSPLSTSSNPGIALDQAWLRFDIAHTVFVTAGEQHVRWGVGRFWSPTDYLTPQFRNPLLPFDPRLGASMVKLHLPLEAQGWNFYAIGLLDNQGPAGIFGQLGAAGRAEFLVGGWEIGLDAIYQRAKDPDPGNPSVTNYKYTGRYGIDISGPLWLFDFAAELSLRPDYPGLHYDIADTSRPLAPPLVSKLSGLEPAATLRAEIAIPYAPNLLLTIGVEYFYNSNGYTNPAVYPWLIFNGAYTPFYVGQHYGSLFALTPAPWDKDHENLTLSNLANLSDGSFISRFDYSIRVLQKLTLEAYVAYHYGDPHGEFRLGIDNPNDFTTQPGNNGTCPSPTTLTPTGSCFVPAFHIPPPAFELGVGARIAI